MKYFISFLIVFIFIGMIVNSFHLNAPKIDLYLLWQNLTSPFNQLEYLQYNNNDYGWLNIFKVYL